MTDNHSFPTLFSSYHLGPIELKNRIVMAPMTRSRAIGNIPNTLMAEYYAQRAGAGLIISEGTSPSPNGLGYARIPGIFTTEQVEGWKLITQAVHEKGSKIFVQLMHSGRVSHALNLPEGAITVAPSAIAAAGQMWTDQQQMQDHSMPQEIADIPALIAEFVHAAKLAMNAGFDGVEIHAANGYLPMQFLNTASNQRSDAYGGNTAARNRFVVELVEAIAGAVGGERTGIRLSPGNPFNGMAQHEGDEAQYIALAGSLGSDHLAYVHFLDFGIPESIKDAFGQKFATVMLNGAYTAERAEATLAAGKAQLISFGSSFIANPDLPARMLAGAPLAQPDQSTFYMPGEKGYTDYPVMA